MSSFCCNDNDVIYFSRLCWFLKKLLNYFVSVLDLKMFRRALSKRFCQVMNALNQDCRMKTNDMYSQFIVEAFFTRFISDFLRVFMLNKNCSFARLFTCLMTKSSKHSRLIKNMARGLHSARLGERIVLWLIFKIMH